MVTESSHSREEGAVPLRIALLSRSVVAHSLGGMETHGEALR
jgi:hypothetical protein